MRRNQNVLWAAMVIFAASTAFVCGQEANVSKEDAKPLKVVDPRRNIQFQMMDEPLQKMLTRADSKLLEQRFVAEITIGASYKDLLPHRKILTSLTTPSQFPPGVKFSLFFVDGRSSKWNSFQDYFAALIADVPEAKRPSADVLTLLLDQATKGFVWCEILKQTPEVRDDAFNVFYILADSEDQAKQLTKALLTLLDYGVSLPAQATVVQMWQEAEQKLHDEQERRTKALEKSETLKKSLADVPYISKDAITDFRIRRHLMEVDLAGIRARSETVSELLSARDKLNDSRIDQLEELKLAAEVELAGLAAREKALSHLIELGEQRKRISGAELMARRELAIIGSKVLNLNREIEQLRLVFEVTGPFPLRGNKVRIRPVEWTPGK